MTTRAHAAAAVVALAALGACTSSHRNVPQPVPGPDSGGTVTVLQYKAPETLDPQRMYVARDLADLGRLVYRSLVALPTSTDPAVAGVPVPDLATDTGTPNADDTAWSFTLKLGVRWQDGRPITCEDLRYGVSRTFATTVITGGPTYAQQYLDIPTDPRTGRSVYTGPYDPGHSGRAAFDRAVSCDGDTITYRFTKPWLDFPLAIASLGIFDPYRRDQDHGQRSPFAVFSDGPYRLQGTVDAEHGFTLVRNPEWDASTDSIRKALPERWSFEIGTDPETQYAQLIADRLPDAITVSSVPGEDVDQVTGAVADRAALVDSPFTDYLLPGSRSSVMRDPQVRLALAQATDRLGYSQALGGRTVSVPASSIVNPGVPGYTPNPAFADLPPAGDVAQARRTLETAGVRLPVPFVLTYGGGTPETEDAASALKRSWDAAGFKVTLNELPEGGFCVIQAGCRLTYDLLLTEASADWPSIGSVMGSVFDSRRTTSPTYQGYLVDGFHDPAVDRRIDTISAITDRARADAAWTDLDATLGKDADYIPLDVPQFYFLRGANIAGYVDSIGTSRYPDLARIGLKDPAVG